MTECFSIFQARNVFLTVYAPLRSFNINSFHPSGPAMWQLPRGSVILFKNGPLSSIWAGKTYFASALLLPLEKPSRGQDV